MGTGWKHPNEMMEEQSQLLAMCRRTYKARSSEPETIIGRLLYPCVQLEHDSVVLVSSDSHPAIVAVAVFRHDGHPLRFEDYRTGEAFRGFGEEQVVGAE